MSRSNPKHGRFASRSDCEFDERMQEILHIGRLGRYADCMDQLNELEENLSADDPDLTGQRCQLAYSKGYIHLKLQDTKASLQNLEESLELAKQCDDPIRFAGVYNNLGVYYNYTGDYVLALEYFLKSLELKEKYDKDRIGPTLNNIGLLFTRNENYQAALHYLVRSLRSKKADDKTARSNSYNNIGMVHANLGNFEDALCYYRRTLELKQELNDTHAVSKVHNNMGEVYTMMGRYEDAIHYHNLALIYKRNNGFKREIPGAAANLARALYHIKAYEKALPLAEEAISDPDLMAPVIRADAFKVHSLICAALGNHTAAYRSLLRSVEIREEVVDVNRQKDLRRLEQKYLDAFKQNERAQEEGRQLADKNRELEHFRMAASHDLREPIRNLSSIARLLKSAIKHDQSKEIERYLKLLDDNSGFSLQLLDDLLAISRLGSLPQEFSSIRTSDVWKQALQNLDSRLVESGIFICEDIAETAVYGSRSQLTALLQNLLSNAIKFAGRNENPQISFRSLGSADSVVWEVTDNGPGIPEELHVEIFQMFRKWHPDELTSGTGAGLAIAEQIVRNHGATIDVVSSPGEGASFRIRFPAGEFKPQPSTAIRE